MGRKVLQEANIGAIMTKLDKENLDVEEMKPEELIALGKTV